MGRTTAEIVEDVEKTLNDLRLRATRETDGAMRIGSALTQIETAWTELAHPEIAADWPEVVFRQPRDAPIERIRKALDAAREGLKLMQAR